MASINVGSYDEYLDYLEVHPDEFGELFNTILINVTTFFRDPADVGVPARARSSRHAAAQGQPTSRSASGAPAAPRARRPTRSRCCSPRLLGPEQFRERVKIYATDVDEEALAIARAGASTDRRAGGRAGRAARALLRAAAAAATCSATTCAAR